MREKNHTKMPQTILVVDDQKESRYKLIQHLKAAQEEYELLSAPNGQVAFEVARTLLPDLIITDWDMPKMNGIEFVQAIKQEVITQDIPILMVTGMFIDSEDLANALDVGAVDYIRKPVEKLELWARVSSTLALKHSFEVIKQQNDEIARQKNKELSNKAFDIYRKSQLLKKIRDIAHQHQETPAMRQIINVVKDATADLEEWFIFKQHFDQVHPQFVVKLRKQYPQLTNEDIKHCVFARLHLSNKEIAHLLNIHVDSVYTHHYRIRKKLGLPNGVRFSDYITGLVP
jgi:response regulator RpfG family c-di-GMP phosphodiesterase